MTDKTKTTPPEVIYWDWKGSIDIDHLNDALKSVFDGKNLPLIYNVDTGQDCYGVVVSSGVMTPDQIQAAWEAAGNED